VSRLTYRQPEKGDSWISMAVYAMALFVRGLPDVFNDLADVRCDDTVLLLDAERLPKQVRVKRKPTAS
jgi:hypothetical protein